MVHLSSTLGGLPAAMVSQCARQRQRGANIAAQNGLRNDAIESLNGSTRKSCAAYCHGQRGGGYCDRIGESTAIGRSAQNSRSRSNGVG